jgi:hypothetical protein
MSRIGLHLDDLDADELRLALRGTGLAHINFLISVIWKIWTIMLHVGQKEEV